MVWRAKRRPLRNLLAGLAAGSLLCGLCACGSAARDPDPPRTPTASPTPTPEPTPRPLDPRTVGYWRFEEGGPGVAAAGEGAIRDSSPLADHGTPSGPIYLADVPRELIPQTYAHNTLALGFDNLDDEVRFASRFLLNDPGDATVELWFKHPGDDHEAIIWGRPDSDDTNRFHIWVNHNATMGADYRSPSGEVFSITASIPFTPNAWTHFAITRSADTYRAYRDGILMSTITDPAPDLPTSVGWKLSSREGFELSGRVDELRLVRAALSPAELLNASPAP